MWFVCVHGVHIHVYIHVQVCNYCVAYPQMPHESCLTPVYYHLPSILHSVLAALGQAGKVILNPRGEKERREGSVEGKENIIQAFRKRERDRQRSRGRVILVSNDMLQ